MRKNKDSISSVPQKPLEPQPGQEDRDRGKGERRKAGREQNTAVISEGSMGPPETGRAGGG